MMHGQRVVPATPFLSLTGIFTEFRVPDRYVPIQIPSPSVADSSCFVVRKDRLSILTIREVCTQTCRFCSGDMHLTGRTVRPRVSELLAMPLSRFRQAQAGFTVTLGDRLPQIEAERCGDESAPVMGERAQQIRRQLSALMNSSYL